LYALDKAPLDIPFVRWLRLDVHAFNEIPVEVICAACGSRGIFVCLPCRHFAIVEACPVARIPIEARFITNVNPIGIGKL